MKRPAFSQLHADTAYSSLDISTWGSDNTTIEYEYDANGSLTSKITSVTSTSEVTEAVDSTYNLQGRLETVTTTPYASGSPDDPVEITEYTYDPDGIRTGKHTWTETSGTGNGDDVYTDYLIDPYNHTGHAQVLEETTDDGTDLTRTQYTIGDDVISQTESTYDSGWTASDTQYLLYDGHGSTRQLADSSGTVIDGQNYSYDGYGVMLSDDSAASGADVAATADTTMLYAGEQYDSSAAMYYNRARYYNPSNGLFNRVDPYAGNRSDPQSLHKYAYCHNNPINAIDPTGMFSVVGFALSTLNVTGIMMTVASFAVKGIQIGLNVAQLSVLGDFMIELNRSPVPDLITKLQIRNVVGQLAINLVGKTLGIGTQMLKDGITILAFSILLRGTIGFLRSMKNARAVANAAKASGPITDPSRLLPAPKMHKHHIFPQAKKFRLFFDRAGIKISKYSVEIEQATHLRGVHGKGIADLPGKWNPAWKNFFMNNPNVTAKQIFQQAGRMMDDFGLSDLPIKPY